VVVQEGESYLNEHPSKRYDLVLADLTEPYDTAGATGHLSRNIFSPRFYEHVKRHMTSGGILVVQSGGVTYGDKVDKFHRSIVNGLRECFSSVCTAYEYVHSYDQIWTLTLASDYLYSMPDLDPDPILERRGITSLRHYDSISHRRAFSPPKHLRRGAVDR
jgi:spermidine synthase